MITNLLERKQEAELKKAYTPNVSDSDYLAELKAKYTRALWFHQSSHRYFNDKSLQAYMDRAADDSFLYVKQSRKDSWHASTRVQRPREKANAVLSAILDQDLSSELYSWDEHGKDERKAADVAQSLLANSDYLEDSEEKKKMRAFELLRYGTVANEVSWLHTKRVEKVGGAFDFTTGEMKEGHAKEVTDFEGVWTKIVPLNRVILGDINKYFIAEQPYIWKEYVMTYDEAYTYFHNWKNWEFVKAIGELEDSWNDTAMQVDTERTAYAEQIFVRMRIYENRWSDEYAIILNDVLMTPVGMAMPTPDKQYSITWTQLEMFDQSFAYGRSFFAVLHNDSVILDFLYNAMIDKSRQGLEPPIIASFKNLINKNVFAPGKITQGDVNFKRAVDHNGVTQADISIAQFVEENLNKASVSPMMQGQGAGGPQTAYEIREQQKNALRLIGLVLYSIARMERDLAEKKLAYILKHYPEMKVASVDKKSKDVIQTSRTFVIRGSQAKSAGVGRKEISFGEPPAPESAEAFLNQMMMEEDAATREGERMKRVVVDPEFLRNLKYVFQIVVNPSQRKSKLADVQEAREKYATYIQNPIIDPEWATRLLLRANDDDEEAALKKQSAGMVPGQMAGAQGAGAPGSSLGAIPTQSQGTNAKAVGAENNPTPPNPNMKAMMATEGAM